MPSSVIVAAAVEGIVDEAVACKVVAHAGGQIGDVYGKAGKALLRMKIRGYNNAARRSPWLVLVDLDGGVDCAPPLCRAWLPEPAPLLCFRVAVRQVEAWLIADADRLAEFLCVAKGKVPCDPETLPNAKAEMVNLARYSRRRAIREDMVPREGSGRAVGPAYSSRLIEFATLYWVPEIAAQRADSLGRAIACLKRLIEMAKPDVERGQGSAPFAASGTPSS